jgi:hypothetical protein
LKFGRQKLEICRQEAPTLVKELIRLATSAESAAVRVAAVKEMFDRGFGRATQPIEGSMTYGVSEQLAELFKENAGGTLGSEIACRAALPPPNGGPLPTMGRDPTVVGSDLLEFRVRTVI